MEQKNNWKQNGNIFKVNDTGSNVPELEPGVYQMYESIFGPYLTKNSDKFEFPYKLYDVQHDFIARVVRTYMATKGNLGLLLNGVKGTGKTVTAELICNALALPVILLTDKTDIESFLKDVHQDVIVFVDEYEKVFEDKEGDGKKKDLLSTMDGVLNSEYRRVFVFTTNEKRISENLLQRPGRLRYIKEFGNLTLNAIIEIVDDMLKHKHLREQTIKFISSLELITIDIVKSVISEVNIHEEDPDVFKDVFNVTEIDNVYNVYKMEHGKRKCVAWETTRLSPMNPDEHDIGDNFYVNNKNLGTITGALEDGSFIARTNVYVAKDETTGKPAMVEVNTQYMVEQVKGKNEIFSEYKWVI